MGEEQVVDAGFEASPDTGDFGAGTGSLEDQLLNTLKDQGGEGDAPKEVSKELPVEPAVEGEKVAKAGESIVTPTFDINGKMSLKAGDRISPEHVKELERGWLRESDYTRKTQELAEVRKEAQGILDIQKKVLEDPRNLFQYIPPEKILSGFSKQEMLAHGLHAAGVTPKAWNEFTAWRNENGTNEGGSPQSEVPQADPYAKQFADYARRLETIERSEMSRAEKATADEAARVEAEQYANYDKEVGAALAEFPAVNKRALLVEIASGDGTKTTKELAKELSDSLENRFQEYLKTKTKQKENTVKAPRGTSVPVLRKQPKSWEDADTAIAQVYGDGTLRSS